MKKIFAAALALCLLLCCAVPAMADNSYFQGILDTYSDRLENGGWDQDLNASNPNDTDISAAIAWDQTSGSQSQPYYAVVNINGCSVLMISDGNTCVDAFNEQGRLFDNCGGGGSSNYISIKDSGCLYCNTVPAAGGCCTGTLISLNADCSYSIVDYWETYGNAITYYGHNGTDYEYETYTEIDDIIASYGNDLSISWTPLTAGCRVEDAGTQTVSVSDNSSEEITETVGSGEIIETVIPDEPAIVDPEETDPEDQIEDITDDPFAGTEEETDPDDTTPDDDPVIDEPDDPGAQLPATGSDADQPASEGDAIVTPVTPQPILPEEITDDTFPITGTAGDTTWTLTADGTLTFSGSGSMGTNSMLAVTSEQVETNALLQSTVTNVVIEDGISDITGYAFQGFALLTTVSIPESVTSINQYAFDGCTALAVITYAGTQSQWQSVSVADGNTALDTASIECSDGTINAPAAVTPTPSNTNETETTNTETTNTNIPSDAFSWEGHYYYYYDDAADWDAANANCVSRGGHLATLTSAEEDAAVYGYLTSLGVENAYFGFTDTAVEGEYVWVTGEATDYTNWADDEPNQEFGNEDYGMYYEEYPDGTWNDGDGGANTPGGSAYLCEWDTMTVTRNDDLDTDLPTELPSDIKADVLFVLDLSSSMNSNGRLSDMKNAVSNMIDKLDAYSNNTVHYQLITFSNSMSYRTNGTWQGSDTFYSEYIAGLSAGGGTNFEAALTCAGSVNWESGYTHIVVFLTDGEPTYHGTSSMGGGGHMDQDDYEGALAGVATISCDRLYILGVDLSDKGSSGNYNSMTPRQILDALAAHASGARSGEVTDIASVDQDQYFQDLADDIAYNIDPGPITPSVPDPVVPDALSGSCGDSCTWQLDTSTGTLVVQGTGPMYDYALPNSDNISNGTAAPWMHYADSITTVRVESGVTRVGSYAFYGLKNLTKVILSETVATIGRYAFAECTSLSYLSFGSALTTLEEGAFADCSKLTDIYYTGSQDQWNGIRDSFNTSTTTTTNQNGIINNGVVNIHVDGHHDAPVTPTPGVVTYTASTSPKTGDETPIALYIGLTLLMLGLFAGTAAVLLRRRGRR